MVAPSGEQYEISGGGYRAVVTECGAGLRLLEYDGRPVLAGYPADAMAPSGCGQLLLPWPNRIADGAYSFDGRDHQLALSEPARHNATHGLTRWSPWTVEEHGSNTVSLMHRLMAQKGYPWTVDLHVLYDLSADGLTVTVTATNLAPGPAPYAQGAHPYLTVAGDDAGCGPDIDDWELTLPARTRATLDDRKIPTGREPVARTEFDFRSGQPLRGHALDTPFTDLDRTPDGRAEVRLHHPGSGRTAALWMDRAHRWVQVYTGDDLGEQRARRAVAVEPMTAPPNAFATGEDLIVLAPAGEDGDEHSSSWGIQAL